MSPIMLALTAATPIFKGLLADIDVRWDVISAAVDDRTPAERGEISAVPPTAAAAAGGGGGGGGGCGGGGADTPGLPISKSRYASISAYISPFPSLLPKYNDLDIRTDPHTYKTLLEAGMDPVLARHFAHLFIRDPLVIYSDKIILDDTTHNDHFENIQSTNWQTVRFKPPPPGSPIGWRVEFRPMEVQFSDFENAAFATFVVLLTRIISSFELNLYLPLSLVDLNMQTAHKRDAVRKEKFYFRKHIVPELNGASTNGGGGEHLLLSIDEIMNGNQNASFKGLLPLMNVYLASAPVEPATRHAINTYLSFISKRASGELVTPATWIRTFVTQHKDYKHDSVVSDEICYDLVRACKDIAEGTRKEPSLLANFV